VRPTGELIIPRRVYFLHAADPKKFHHYAEKSPTNRRNAAHDWTCEIKGDNHGENV